MTTVLNGILGGLAAAMVVELLLQAASLVGSRTDRPTSEWFGSEVTGANRLRPTAFRLGYGTVAGGVLVWFELAVLGMLAVPPALGEALLVSVGWSLALFSLTGAVGLPLALGRRPTGRELVGTLFVHLVYGVLLGLWIRLTWIT